MNTTTPSRSSLTVAHTLAQLLERLERSAVPVDPNQYQTVVRRLGSALMALQGSVALDALLKACPASAELYENLNYDVAGLCRSPLDKALEAELQTRALFARVGRPALP